MYDLTKEETIAGIDWKHGSGEIFEKLYIPYIDDISTPLYKKQAVVIQRRIYKMLEEDPTGEKLGNKIKLNIRQREQNRDAICQHRDCSN